MNNPDRNLGCRRCCTYPHGIWSILVSIFALIAFIITDVALGTCYFVWVDGYGRGFLWREYDWEYSYYYYDYYECDVYTSKEKDLLFDAAWKTGKAFAVVATVIGGIMMIVMFVFACVAVQPSAFKIIGSIFVMLGIFNLLMLVGLASDMCPDSSNDTDGCELGPGAILAIVGAVLYFVCAGFTFAVGPARDKYRASGPAVTPHVQEFVPDAVTVTETILPDGTVKQTTTTTNPDGTKTIQESITTPTTPQEEQMYST